MAGIRGATRYPDSPNRDSIQQGLEFQDLIMEALLFSTGLMLQNYSSKKYQIEKGENIQGVEIKLDNRCTDTYRLSIEIAEKTYANGSWYPSGIYAKSKPRWYVQGNPEVAWLFTTAILQKLEQATNGDGSPRYVHKEEATVRAFYLPFKDAEAYGVRVLPTENKSEPYQARLPF